MHISLFLYLWSSSINPVSSTIIITSGEISFGSSDGVEIKWWHWKVLWQVNRHTQQYTSAPGCFHAQPVIMKHGNIIICVEGPGRGKTWYSSWEAGGMWLVYCRSHLLYLPISYRKSVPKTFPAASVVSSSRLQTLCQYVCLTLPEGISKQTLNEWCVDC
jgi:hypothetical protein